MRSIENKRAASIVVELVSMDFVMYASPLTLPPSLLAWLSFFSNGKSNQLSTLRIIMIRLGSRLLQISIYILKHTLTLHVVAKAQ